MRDRTFSHKFRLRLLVGLIAFLGLGGLLGVIGFVIQLRSQPQVPASTIIQSWCRLAPFPEDPAQASLDAEGSAFTRSFTYQFTVDTALLDQWIAASPGLQTANVEVMGTTMRYVVVPNEAAWCEVNITIRNGSRSDLHLLVIAVCSLRQR